MHTYTYMYRYIHICIGIGLGIPIPICVHDITILKKKHIFLSGLIWLWFIFNLREHKKMVRHICTQFTIV